jgi:hypothetical protein
MHLPIKLWQYRYINIKGGIPSNEWCRSAHHCINIERDQWKNTGVIVSDVRCCYNSNTLQIHLPIKLWQYWYININVAVPSNECRLARHCIDIEQDRWKNKGTIVSDVRCKHNYNVQQIHLPIEFWRYWYININVGILSNEWCSLAHHCIDIERDRWMYTSTIVSDGSYNTINNVPQMHLPIELWWYLTFLNDQCIAICLCSCVAWCNVVQTTAWRWKIDNGSHSNIFKPDINNTVSGYFPSSTIPCSIKLWCYIILVWSMKHLTYNVRKTKTTVVSYTNGKNQ